MFESIYGIVLGLSSRYNSEMTYIDRVKYELTNRSNKVLAVVVLIPPLVEKLADYGPACWDLLLWPAAWYAMRGGSALLASAVTHSLKLRPPSP